jgi:hypothetical protein
MHLVHPPITVAVRSPRGRVFLALLSPAVIALMLAGCTSGPYLPEGPDGGTPVPDGGSSGFDEGSPGPTPQCAAAAVRNDGCQGPSCAAVRLADAIKPVAVSVDGDQLFYIDQSDQDAQGELGRLMRVPVAGGDATVLADRQVGPTDVLAIDGQVYWVGSPFSTLFSDNRVTTVQRVPAAGGVRPTLLSQDGGWSLAADATQVYWLNEDIHSVARDATDASSRTVFTDQTNATLVAANATGVYWLGDVGERLMRGDPTTGETRELLFASDLLTLAVDGAGLAVDDTHVYWLDGDHLARLSIDGGTPQLLASGQRGPAGVGHAGLAVSSGFVYWINRSTDLSCSDGTVMKMPVTGGTPMVVAGGQASPAGLALDGDSVYWVNQGHDDGTGGAVMKTAR